MGTSQFSTHTLRPNHRAHLEGFTALSDEVREDEPLRSATRGHHQHPLCCEVHEGLLAVRLEQRVELAASSRRGAFTETRHRDSNEVMPQCAAHGALARNHPAAPTKETARGSSGLRLVPAPRRRSGTAAPHLLHGHSAAHFWSRQNQGAIPASPHASTEVTASQSASTVQVPTRAQRSPASAKSRQI